MLACSIVSLTPLVAFSGTSYGSRPNNFLASLPVTPSGVALPLKFVSPSPPGKSLRIHVQRSAESHEEFSYCHLRRRQPLAEINSLSAKISRAVEGEESVSHSSSVKHHSLLFDRQWHCRDIQHRRVARASMFTLNSVHQVAMPYEA